MKKLSTFLLLLSIIGLSACNKNNNGGCGTQMCSKEFVTLAVLFTNKDGSAVSVSDIELINLRTNKSIKRPSYPPNVDYLAGTVLVADDNTKNEFSTDGDDLKVTAKSDKTGQVKSVTIKIKGGCNCHVSKVSGPDKVAFD